MQLEVLGAQLSVPGGTLSADETISIVETSFNLAITLGVSRTEGISRIGEGTLQGVQNFAGEPGSITPVRVFELAVKKTDGTTGQIDKPIRMTWDFKPEHLAAAGGDFANLLMIGQDAATGKWSPVPQVAKTATSVTFEVPHFSLWAFAIRHVAVTPGAPGAPGAAGTGAGAGAPPVAPAITPRPANTGTGLPAEQAMTGIALPITLVVLGLGILGGLGYRTVRRRS